MRKMILFLIATSFAFTALAAESPYKAVPYEGDCEAHSGENPREYFFCDGTYWSRGQQRDKLPLYVSPGARVDYLMNTTEYDELNKFSEDCNNFYNANNYEEELKLAQSWQDIYAQKFGSEHAFVIYPLLYSGIALYYLNRFDEAEALMTKALAIAEKNNGFDHRTISEVRTLGWRVDKAKRQGDVSKSRSQAAAAAGRQAEKATANAASSATSNEGSAGTEDYSGVLMWIGIAVLAVIVGYGIVKTFQDEAVFFSGHDDLFLSLVPFGLFLVGRAYNSSPSFRGLMIISAIAAIAYSYIKAFRCNPGQKFLAFSIGTGRCTVGYVIPLLMVLFYFSGNSRRKGEADTAYALRRGFERLETLATIAGLGYILERLVGHSQATLDKRAAIATAEAFGIFKNAGAEDNPQLVQAQSVTPAPQQSGEPLKDSGGWLDVPHPAGITTAQKLAYPDPRPAVFDQSVKAWLLRLTVWGDVKIFHNDPAFGEKRKPVSPETLEKKLCDDKLNELFGLWDIELAAVDKVRLFRPFIDLDGKRVVEEFFVEIDLKPILKKCLGRK